MAIRPCRPDPNYFVGTTGRVVRASTSHGNTMMYMCMGSNPGQPGKKFVKNDFTNQVKFELSTLRHDYIYIYIYASVVSGYRVLTHSIENPTVCPVSPGFELTTSCIWYIYIQRITMCPHGYHHSGSMATPALGTRDVRLHIVWICAYTLFWIALWSHQSAQTANSERCIVQIVTTIYIYIIQQGNPSYCVSIYTIYMYSGVTSGRVLDGELLYTKILEVNMLAFAYRLFRRDFSPLNGAFCIGTHSFSSFYINLY